MSALDISVAVFAGTSQPALHATLAAAQRAIAALAGIKASAELLIVLHEASPPVLELAQEMQRTGTGLIDAGKRDLGTARQLAASAANGRYFAMLEAGDMCSTNWLAASFRAAREEKACTSVWRPELIVGCGLDFFLDDGLFTRFQSSTPCDASAARLLVEELYAPAFLAERKLLETTRFPSVDESRGWDDVDAWWTANAVGNGHPQSIVEDTFLYRWNKGDSDLRQTRIGPTSLSAQTLASDGRKN